MGGKKYIDSVNVCYKNRKIDQKPICCHCGQILTSKKNKNKKSVRDFPTPTHTPSSFNTKARNDRKRVGFHGWI